MKHHPDVNVQETFKLSVQLQTHAYAQLLTSDWSMDNVDWFVHKTNGGQLDNANAKHHLLESMESVQLTVQPMKDGIQSNVSVLTDGSE